MSMLPQIVAYFLGLTFAILVAANLAVCAARIMNKKNIADKITKRFSSATWFLTIG